MKKGLGPKRVAVISPYYGLVGGAEKFAFEVTERLALEEAFEIHVFARQWQARNKRIVFHRLPNLPFPRFLRPLTFANSVASALKSHQFDIIHSHARIFSYHFLTHHGIPHTTWIREVRRKKHPSLFDRLTVWVEKKGINNPHAPIIMPVSSLARIELQLVFGVSDSRIQIIPPGLALERFKRFDRDVCRQEIRAEHGFMPDDIVLLFVGMNFKLKGLDRIIKGLAEFTQNGTRHHGLKLLVVGKGDENKFQRVAHRSGIGDRLVFAGKQPRVEKYYLAADIFIALSRFDAFGIVVLEAMAAGLPVIITETMGASDVVRQGVNGYVLSASKWLNELQHTLRHLLNHEHRLAMGHKAKQAARKYDWNKTTAQVFNLYARHLEAKQ